MAPTPEVALFLIEKGLSPLEKNTKTETVLMWAAYSGNLALVEKYIALGVDVHATKGTLSALMYAAQEGKTEVVKYLHEKAGIPLDHSLNASSALSEAAFCGRIETVQYIIDSGVKCCGELGFYAM